MIHNVSIVKAYLLEYKQFVLKALDEMKPHHNNTGNDAANMSLETAISLMSDTTKLIDSTVQNLNEKTSFKDFSYVMVNINDMVNEITEELLMFKVYMNI